MFADPLTRKFTSLLPKMVENAEFSPPGTFMLNRAIRVFPVADSSTLVPTLPGYDLSTAVSLTPSILRNW